MMNLKSQILKFQILILLTLPTLIFADNPKPASFTEKVKGTLVKFDMLPIPGGKFVFSPDGKETPREVEIKPFFMGKTEITWRQYETWYLQLDLPEKDRKLHKDFDAIGRPSQPYGVPDHSWGRDNMPVLHTTYNAGVKYCEWLSTKTGRTYRLPTEAEWEYACRAGALTPQVDPKALLEMAWCKDNSKNEAADGDPTTHEVATKKPNAFGLYDMLGNVGEWCTPLAGKVPVIRGGTYLTKAKDMHCGTRAPYVPEWQANDSQDPKSKWWMSDGPFCGFRVICEH
jgi:formylglycine-generating enzyme required for sulfatase activity